MKSLEFARRLGRIEHELVGNTKARRNVLGKLVRRMRAAYVIREGRIVAYRLPDGSAVCRKQRFPSDDAAAAELARIKATATHAYIPARFYPCGYCKGFHLTSRS